MYDGDCKRYMMKNYVQLYTKFAVYVQDQRVVIAAYTTNPIECRVTGACQVSVECMSSDLQVTSSNHRVTSKDTQCSLDAYSTVTRRLSEVTSHSALDGIDGVNDHRSPVHPSYNDQILNDHKSCHAKASTKNVGQF